MWGVDNSIRLFSSEYGIYSNSRGDLVKNAQFCGARSTTVVRSPDPSRSDITLLGSVKNMESAKKVSDKSPDTTSVVRALSFG